jgi:hypothetical protein
MSPFPRIDMVVVELMMQVAQAENGDIGLVICSFLEPLT